MFGRVGIRDLPIVVRCVEGATVVCMSGYTRMLYGNDRGMERAEAPATNRRGCTVTRGYRGAKQVEVRNMRVVRTKPPRVGKTRVREKGDVAESPLLPALL